MSTSGYTLIGTPFSTFTRTIALGLRHKGLNFTQIATPPQSNVAKQNHPFGYLPTLIIHEVDGKRVDLKLRESQAIVRYLDRVAPAPSLHIAAGDGNALIPEKMWELVSLIACFGFPAVEGGVVKVRVKGTDEGKLSDAEIKEELKEGLERLRYFLDLVESLVGPQGFLYGSKPTWADFYLFPLLADLRATPEAHVISPRLKEWMGYMDALDAVKATREGTLEVGARP